MTVEIRLFAILRERAGTDVVRVDLPEPATVADALAAVARLPGLGALARGGARMAVNREYAVAEHPLAAGDELALIPPVSGGDAGRDAGDTGGGPRIHVHVGPAPLSLEALTTVVADPGAGAVVSFQGLPRDVPALDYEAYAEMAIERMEAILSEVGVRHGLIAAAAAHRTGTVPAGEASVVVVASSAHRGEAFAGAREILDRIKAEAPIWKVEVDADGERRRVEGTLPEPVVRPAAGSVQIDRTVPG